MTVPWSGTGFLPSPRWADAGPANVNCGWVREVGSRPRGLPSVAFVPQREQTRRSAAERRLFALQVENPTLGGQPRGRLPPLPYPAAVRRTRLTRSEACRAHETSPRP